MVVTRRKKRVLYRLAPIWKRFLSFIIDMLILEFFVFSKFEGLMNSMIPKIPFTTVTESAVIQISVIAGIIAFFVILYFTVLEYAFGQTLGDMAIGLHLKTLIGEEPGFWRLFVSNLSFLPFFPFIMLWIIDPAMIIFSNSHQRFMQILVGLQVVEIYSLEKGGY